MLKVGISVLFLLPPFKTNIYGTERCQIARLCAQAAYVSILVRLYEKPDTTLPEINIPHRLKVNLVPMRNLLVPITYGINRLTIRFQGFLKFAYIRNTREMLAI